MLRILLTLAAASAAIYVLLALRGWARQARASRTTILEDHRSATDALDSATGKAPPRAYLWGLAFAVFFYYGFPIWWARYGLRRAITLTLVCVCAVGLVQYLLVSADVIEIGNVAESFGAGLLLAVPIRAIAGLYVAKHDREWRIAILAHRRPGQTGKSTDT
jgi:hypothetical protein